jgi:hypothetical protein
MRFEDDESIGLGHQWCMMRKGTFRTTLRLLLTGYSKSPKFLKGENAAVYPT